MQWGDNDAGRTPATDRAPELFADEGAPGAASLPMGAGPGPRVMAADTLQGDDVRNASDEKLGEITDIMIDVPTGRVAYAVMSVGGVLGVGDKLLAVPWSALRLDPGSHCFRLEVSKDHVDLAPGFDKDHWPATADPQWGDATRGDDGATPHER